MSYSRPSPNADGMISPKVDNLTYRTSPNTLRRVFEKSGRVGDVYIPWDRFTEEPRGFAVVRFHDKRHAEDAMDALDGIVLDAGADLDLSVDLPSAMRSLHLALMIDLHQPLGPDLLEVPSPSPPLGPDLPQQPRPGLDP
ncbi:serine/arginine-rich splicing factor 2-like [Balaenoptera ricei]|uniref:serine/arginine-rich splicing factor 2-like n=1 Tax=Balaenoptera ricei TaxID=2746895 RepID=UPI0028BE6135|nr:serine/arginine-rich splicing factor 2-like [Balaenoptera ricei]